MDATLSQPIQRFGVWWARSEAGSWLRFDAAAGTWEPSEASPPPPPPPPPLVGAADPAADLLAEPLREIGLAAPDVAQPKPKREMPEWLRYFRSRAISVSVGMAVILALVAFMGLRPGSSGASAVDAFVPLNGYQYGEIPAEQLDSAKQMIDQVPFVSEYLKDIDARSVLKDGAPAAMAVVISIDPEKLAEMDRSAMATGFQSTSGVKLKAKRLQGMEAYRADVFEASVILFVDPAGFVVEVVGTDTKAVLDIAKQLAAGAKARAAA